MRWLLIALVLLLQLQAPAVAEAAPMAAACHEMPVMDHDQSASMAHHSGQLPDEQPDQHAGKAHLCPGCSIPGIAPLVAPLNEAAPCPPVAASLSALRSLAQPPHLRPPRLA